MHVGGENLQRMWLKQQIASSCRAKEKKKSKLATQAMMDEVSNDEWANF